MQANPGKKKQCKKPFDLLERKFSKIPFHPLMKKVSFYKNLSNNTIFYPPTEVVLHDSLYHVTQTFPSGTKAVHILYPGYENVSKELRELNKTAKTLVRELRMKNIPFDEELGMQTEPSLLQANSSLKIIEHGGAKDKSEEEWILL